MPFRQYSASRFSIVIDGATVGFATSVGGGEAFAEVISTTAPSGAAEKQPGPVAYAPIELEVDTTLQKGFYDWVIGFLDGSQKPKDGVIRFLDYNMGEQSRLEWTAGLITEVGFPAADATNKDSASLRVVLQPESTRRLDGSGSKVAGSGASSHQKRWLPANFRFSIAGLENPTKKVNAVDALMLRRPVSPGPGAVVVGALEVPNVVFTIAATEAKSFYDWFTDFVIKGNNSPSNERTGSLVFLDLTRTDPLIGVAMQGLGIVRVSEEREAQGAAAIARVKVELYCEGVQLSPAPAQPASPGSTPGGSTPGGSTPGGTPSTDTLTTATLTAALLQAFKLVAAGSGDSTAPMTRAGAIRGDVVAERLLSTAGPVPDDGAPSASTDLRRDRGREIGTKWASTTATLDELMAVSELEAAEWTALFLPDGHSLIDFLVGEGEIRGFEGGKLELARDEFTEGVVAGAADVQRQAAPHLEGKIAGRDVKGAG
jgi:hypothetical protein